MSSMVIFPLHFSTLLSSFKHLGTRVRSWSSLIRKCKFSFLTCPYQICVHCFFYIYMILSCVNSHYWISATPSYRTNGIRHTHFYRPQWQRNQKHLMYKCHIFRNYTGNSERLSALPLYDLPCHSTAHLTPHFFINPGKGWLTTKLSLLLKW